jgi:uncharacterized protein YgiB involved in biofilm formation
MGWKKQVKLINASTTDNATQAAARIFLLGGCETGLFYQRAQPVCQRAGTDARACTDAGFCCGVPALTVAALTLAASMKD